ncbi:DNA mismatch repair endonuclease MutL [Deferribacterales bacterium Es71-Z0220]|uniref:DNA mismatch repair endonuclease MutL n=1 Tax=Deferrivibrio essentukiensis TaxID=2880922 RepID=UPI001F61F35F|nr:DNA mismatch repair endonuclease MutL [Deferrivibrio essentukiensis]
MSEIKILDQKIANKIAAGEVVERPFNVVKELVENAVDAGATFIRIDIFDGGLGLIKVTDNGRGILPEDLKNAVLRYSTSKISNIEDVYRINTFGFRGEALAAISSVSDFKIESKREGYEAAELQVYFGRVGETKPGKIQNGTTVTVKNLFENVPARRKFIKSISAEQREIIRFVKIFSSINHNIEVELFVDEKNVITFSKYDSMKDRFISSFGLNNVFYINDNHNNIKIEAVLSLPNVQRNRKDYIFVGLNNRVIKDFALTQAVVQAYFRKLPQNKYPAGVVSIKINPDAVDVNVHPTKMNVKFLNDRDVFSAVNKIISSNLGKQQLSNSGSVVYRLDNIQTNYFVKENIINYSSSVDELVTSSYSDTFEEKDEIKVIGQVFDSVILVEKDGEVYFIDQHIAHERVLYEKFISNTNNFVTKIKLVEPIIVELSDNDKDIVLNNLNNFLRLGFELEDFGGNFISILSVPTSIVHKNIENEFVELLNEFNNNKSDNFLDSLSLTMACKTAIKAGEKLTDYEMSKIVKDLFETKNPYTCPHGRPIVYKMSKEEIYKKFHRL